MSTNPMKQVCEALNDGSMSHDDESHIFRQLAVEGRKRIDAFVFEALFRQHLQSIAKMSDVDRVWIWAWLD